MALSFAQTPVQVLNTVVALGSPITATLGSTPTPGNVIFAFLIAGNNTTQPINTGWTTIATAADVGATKLWSAFRIVQTGDTTTTSPWLSGTASGIFTITVWEATGFTAGFNAASNIFSTTLVGTTATTETLPSISSDLLLGGSLYLAIFFQGGSSGTATAPTGFTADFTRDGASGGPHHWIGHQTGIASNTAVHPSVVWSAAGTTLAAIGLIISPGPPTVPIITLSQSASASVTIPVTTVQSITATLGSSPVQGSVIVAYVACGGATLTLQSPGWAQITTSGNGFAAYRIAGASEPTAQTPYQSTSGGSAVAKIMVWNITGFVGPFNASAYLVFGSATSSTLTALDVSQTSSSDPTAGGGLLLVGAGNQQSTSVGTGSSGLVQDISLTGPPNVYCFHYLGVPASATVDPVITVGAARTSANVIAMLFTSGTLSVSNPSATFTPTGSISFIKFFHVFLTASLTSIGALSKKTSYTIGASLTSAGNWIYNQPFTKLVFSAGLNPTVAFVKKTAIVPFIAALTPTASFISSRLHKLSLSASTIMSGAFSMLTLFARPHYFFTIIRDQVGSFFTARDQSQASTIITDTSDTGNTIRE